MVYFKLKDPSTDAKNLLLRACREYLTGHPGQSFFACGTLCEELARDVNDRDFDVSLHIVFESKQAHDTYQDAARHHQFVEEQRGNWAKVRVFDSIV
jgi:hypothetical protein